MSSQQPQLDTQALSISERIEQLAGLKPGLNVLKWSVLLSLIATIVNCLNVILLWIGFSFWDADNPLVVFALIGLGLAMLVTPYVETVIVLLCLVGSFKCVPLADKFRLEKHLAASILFQFATIVFMVLVLIYFDPSGASRMLKDQNSHGTLSWWPMLFAICFLVAVLQLLNFLISVAKYIDDKQSLDNGNAASKFMGASLLLGVLVVACIYLQSMSFFSAEERMTQFARNALSLFSYLVAVTGMVSIVLAQFSLLNLLIGLRRRLTELKPEVAGNA